MLAAALEAEVDQYIAELAAARDERGHRLVVRNGHYWPRTVVTAGRACGGHRAPGERSSRRRGHRRAQVVLLQDPGPVVPQVAEDLRGPAAALPAWTVLGGLCARAGAVPRGHGWPVARHGDPADQAVDRRPRRLPGPGPVGSRLRLRVGRRCAPQGEARPGALVHPGPARRPAGRHQGADRPGRGAAGVHRVVGRPAARLPPARHARPGAGDRRRRDGPVEGSGRGVPGCPAPALLAPQSAKGHQRISEVRAAGRDQGDAGDLQRRGPPPRGEGGRGVREDLRAKWPKAVAKIIDDRDELLAFYDFPAEHWVHLRTTNPIESTFSTVKLRTKVTRGVGSPAAALAMVFKLVESAQER